MPAIARTLVTLAGLVLVLCAGWSAPARAQSCTFSFSSYAFGPVDVLAGSRVLAGTFRVETCQGIAANSDARICVHLGPGTTNNGGTSIAPRQLYNANTRTTLGFNISTDSAGAQIVGGNATGGITPSAGAPAEFLIRTTAQGGLPPQANRTFALYATIPAGQTGATPSATAYTRTIQANVRYNYAAGQPTCPTMAGLAADLTFTVSGTVSKACVVGAGEVLFPPSDKLLVQVKAPVANIAVTCTTGTSYTVGLGTGLNSTTVGARKMKHADGTMIGYQLYKDATYGAAGVWGTTAPNTGGGNGTGQQLNFPVWGLVPAQPALSPTAGDHTDSIVVTLTY